MGRRPCCSKELVLNRGAWTAMEDKILSDFILAHGEGKWRHLPERAGLKRCGKSCRLRWLNYLRPGIKRGSISEEEEDLIIRLHKLLGNRWALIAGRLPGRTDNEIKNYWHTKLGKANNTIAKPSSDDQSHDDPKSEPNSAKKRRVCETRTTSSTVVRTKATRFVKPAMVPLVEENETGPIISEVFDRTTNVEELLSPEDSDQLLIASSNLEMDFDVDQSFLLDFLNSTDDWISEPPNYCSDADQANISSSTLASDHQILLYSSEETVLPCGSSELDSIADDPLENWFLI